MMRSRTSLHNTASQPPSPSGSDEDRGRGKDSRDNSGSREESPFTRGRKSVAESPADDQAGESLDSPTANVKS